MDNARTERELRNAGKDYGRALGIKMSKRLKTRPNNAQARSSAVRVREVDIAGGTSSLDKGQLGLERLPISPTTTSQQARVLNPTELWELLQFIAKENASVNSGGGELRTPPKAPESSSYTVSIHEDGGGLGEEIATKDIDPKVEGAGKKRKRKPKSSKIAVRRKLTTLMIATSFGPIPTTFKINTK